MEKRNNDENGTSFGAKDNLSSDIPAESIYGDSAFRIEPRDEIGKGPTEKLIGASNPEASKINSADGKKAEGDSFQKEAAEKEKKREAILGNRDKTGNVDKEEKERDEQKIKVGKRRSYNLGILAVLGIIAVLIVLAGVSVIYYLNKGNYHPLPSSNISETPQQIIRSSQEAMKEVKSYRFKGNANLEVAVRGKKDEDFEKFTFGVKIVGKTNSIDVKSPKIFYNMKAEAEVVSNKKEESKKLSFDLDTVFGNQDKVYYKLNECNLSDFREAAFICAFLNKGKWYSSRKLDKADSDIFYPSPIVGVATYDIDKLRKLYKKYKFIKFEKDLGDTKLNDVEVYHYQAKIDGIAVANFYVDFLEEMKPNYKEEILKKSYNEMLSDLRKGIAEYKEVIDEIANNINVEIWIGKNDRFVYREKISGKFDEKFIKKLMEEVMGSDTSSEGEDSAASLPKGELSFIVDVNMYDFNEPIEVYEPKGAEDLTNKVFFGNPLQSSPLSENSLDSDNDGLSDAEEAFWGTDKNNPDTDRDGYKDGEEVRKGYDPLVPGDARLNYPGSFK